MEMIFVTALGICACIMIFLYFETRRNSNEDAN